MRDEHSQLVDGGDAQDPEGLAHHRRNPLADDKPLVLQGIAHHLALPVELVELLRGLVQELTDEVGQEQVAHALQYLRKLEDVCDQEVLLGVCDRGCNVLERRLVHPCLLGDRLDAHVRVHQVNSRVALEVKHLLVREDIVRDAVLLQISILDTPIPNPVGGLRHVFRGHLRGRALRRCALLELLPRVDDGLVQQIDKLRHLPGSCLELLLVLPEHQPKRHVVKPCPISNPPSLAGGNKDHVKVLALTRVCHVDHSVRLHLMQTVLNRREIR
mmetsp:Transcript_63257/g.155678  ORF Transcript_63257/g.155678 Transcript_63257/m.155678 type:complete len:272 (-) Transcript_63257:954-1769(-)